jgi:hypothetical protein
MALCILKWAAYTEARDEKVMILRKTTLTLGHCWRSSFGVSLSSDAGRTFWAKDRRWLSQTFLCNDRLQGVWLKNSKPPK